MPALWALGYRPVHTYLISQLDLHDAPLARWDRLHAEAVDRASDYELLRLVGPTPDADVDGVVEVFAAINDAPTRDTDADPDHWDADRVRGYDAAMAARRQTVYRVMARHRGTGAWAGHTMPTSGSTSSTPRSATRRTPPWSPRTAGTGWGRC